MAEQADEIRRLGWSGGWILRSAPLIDITISRGADNRTVTAYAATFGDVYEVVDDDGHYDETIVPGAFDAVIRNGIARRAQVLYNHGTTLSGTNSRRAALALGEPLDVRADSRGLLTVTRYAKSDLADEVLQQIRDGVIRAQSFRGAKQASRQKYRSLSGRPLVERLMLGLREYGPAVQPMNTSAQIIGC